MKNGEWWGGWPRDASAVPSVVSVPSALFPMPPIPATTAHVATMMPDVPQHRNRHVIRLHGPWVETAPQAGRRWRVPLALDTWLRREHPADTSLRLSRRFGRPGNLDGSERIWLVWHAADFPVSVRLNDNPLESAPPRTPSTYDVTHRLEPRNELDITIMLEPPAVLPTGATWLVRSVTLEIEETRD